MHVEHVALEESQRATGLLCPSTCSASSLMLQPSPTASRRISSGSTLLQAAAASSLGGSRPPSPGSGDDGGYSPDPGGMISSATPTPEPLSSGGGGASSGGGGKDDSSSNANRMKKKRRKMPIINPLVTLPMWPSKFFLPSTNAKLFWFLFPFLHKNSGDKSRSALPFFYHFKNNPYYYGDYLIFFG